MAGFAQRSLILRGVAAMDRAAGMTTPTKGQPESPTSRSRIRFSRPNIRSPLNTRGNEPVHMHDAGSPSRSREASPLTLPYVDLEAGKHGERDTSEEAVEMRTWSEGKFDSSADKEDGFGMKDVTPRRRTVRQCWFLSQYSCQCEKVIDVSPLAIPKIKLDKQAGPPSFARSEFETVRALLSSVGLILTMACHRLYGTCGIEVHTKQRRPSQNSRTTWITPGSSLVGASESLSTAMEGTRLTLTHRLSYLDLTKQDLEDAEVRLSVESKQPKLDQYRATSIAGNAVWGSVFYS